MNNSVTKCKDILTVATTICAEAGGETYEGKIMVGQVLVNRARLSGVSIRKVCLRPYQFSCWNGKEARNLIRLMRKNPSFLDCLAIATQICEPGYRPVSPATHYHNTTVKPTWAKAMRLCAIVGKHRFYTEGK